MWESIIPSRSSEPGRVCITGQLCKTLFPGHSRAFHTPQLCPTRSALPGSFPGLLTSHLAGVATEAPPQVGDGGCRVRKTQTVAHSLGSGGSVCRAVAWEAMKSRQWFKGTRKWGWWHPQSETRPGVQSREKTQPPRWVMFLSGETSPSWSVGVNLPKLPLRRQREKNEQQGRALSC